MPTTTTALLDTQGFHGRGARRYADRWLAALERAAALRDTELPPLTLRTDGPPQPRVWAERDPVAAARLATARELVTAFAEERHVPVENLLTPDYLRRVLWKPPAVDGPRRWRPRSPRSSPGSGPGRGRSGSSRRCSPTPSSTPRPRAPHADADHAQD